MARETAKFCVILYSNISNGSWICQKLAPEQLQTRAKCTGTVQGRWYGPSITTQIFPAEWSLSSCQTGGTPCWVISLAFGLIGHDQNLEYKDTKQSKSSELPIKMHIQAGYHEFQSQAQPVAKQGAMPSGQYVHCKKELAIFLSPVGMSLTKLSLGGKKLNYSRPGRV